MTRDEIVAEMRFIEGDLNAFRKSMDALSDRKSELEDTSERLRSFMEWPATQALLNVLIMAISRCEGLLEDYRKLLDQQDVPNNVIKLETKS
jgi:hypothetical protein